MRLFNDIYRTLVGVYVGVLPLCRDATGLKGGRIWLTVFKLFKIRSELRVPVRIG